MKAVLTVLLIFIGLAVSAKQTLRATDSELESKKAAHGKKSSIVEVVDVQRVGEKITVCLTESYEASEDGIEVFGVTYTKTVEFSTETKDVNSLEVIKLIKGLCFS